MTSYPKDLSSPTAKTPMGSLVLKSAHEPLHLKNTQIAVLDPAGAVVSHPSKAKPIFAKQIKTMAFVCGKFISVKAWCASAATM